MNFSHKKLTLEGPRIILRTLEQSDATETYASWLRDPEVNRYLATKSATVHSLQEYIAEKDASEDTLAFMIFLKESMQPIGTVKLEKIDASQKRADIALMLGDRSSWGKGLMSEAMRVLMNYGFTSLGLDVIYLGVASDNVRAIELYNKLGFKEVRREIKAWKHTIPNCDHVWMEINRSDMMQTI